MNVSILGFGRVGVALGAALASKGHNVSGVDIDERIINDIHNGVAPFPEKNLDIFIKQYGKNIHATSNFEEVINNTDLSFILVPTPSINSGAFDNKFIYNVLEKTVPYVKKKGRPHFFIVSSTVSPTSMQGFCDFLKERGLEEKRDFHLCYNPAFIRQGSVIKDFLFPDVILMGGSEEDTKQLEGFWKNVVENKPHFIATNFINAEIAKITLNTFVTVKISFANLIGILCEQNLGANADVVMSVIRKSEQIVGEKLLQSGLGYGGPCLPRDNSALRAFAKFSEESDLGKVVDAINKSVVNRIINSIKNLYEKGDRIGILGLAYKPGTYLTAESQALKIAKELAKEFEVRTYDPMAEERTCNTKEEVIENSEIIALLTPWPEFSEIPYEQLKRKKIYDAWRFWEEKLADEDNYYAFGVKAP